MDQLYTQRKFERFDLGLEAQCIIGGNVTSIKCEITEISRVGASMYLLVNEKLRPGQSVMLQIQLPGKINPINAVVKLTWFKKIQDASLYNYATGGKITYIKDEERDALLNFAYRRLIEMEKNA